MMSDLLFRHDNVNLSHVTVTLSGCHVCRHVLKDTLLKLPIDLCHQVFSTACLADHHRVLLPLSHTAIVILYGLV